MNMNNEIRAFVEQEVSTYDFLSEERKKEAVEPIYEALLSIYNKLSEEEQAEYLKKMKK